MRASALNRARREGRKSGALARGQHRNPYSVAPLLRAWRRSYRRASAALSALLLEAPAGAAVLACPSCEADAVSSSGDYCTVCGGENGRHAAFGCGGAWAPGWTEADGGACPSCGVELRVVVDDERAYAEVSAGTT